MKNNDVILLLVGASGSGKSTIAQYMENEYGLKQVLSYTTRAPRDGEDECPTHTFVTDEEFDKLTDMVGYTQFNGYRYCATAEQVDTHDIYVIDPKGIEYFRTKYNGHKTPVVVYIKANGDIRRKRMEKRGDAIEKIIDRFLNDLKEFENVESMADISFHNEVDNEYEWIGDKLYEDYFKKEGGW